MFLLVVLTDASRRPPTIDEFTDCSRDELNSSILQFVHPDNSYPTTSIPIDRAVPRTVLIADCSSVVLRSGIFCFAMSSTCFAVTVPTLLRFGSADPFVRLATFFSSTEAGGVFVMKV